MNEKQTAVANVDRHGLIVELGGQQYALDRPAFKDVDGFFALGQLRDGEIIVAPGIIYRRVPVCEVSVPGAA